MKLQKNEIRTSDTRESFFLEKTQLVQNRSAAYGYSMNRGTVASAMKEPTGREFAASYYFANRSFLASVVRYANEIEIGCKIFSGKNYLKLRRWALRKQN